MTRSVRLERDTDRRRKLHHSWLKYKCQGADYLPPDYYTALLRPYVFCGKPDVEWFQEFLLSHAIKKHPKTLEIGPGTGRATAAFLNLVNPGHLTLLDRSSRMLTWLKDSIPAEVSAELCAGDAIEFCQRTNDRFDLLYSLWSISHAVHQTIFGLGVERGTSEASTALRRLFEVVLKPGGAAFLLHFDSTSPEQVIALRQRSKLFTFFRPGHKSPSQVILEQLFAELNATKTFRVTMRRMLGAPIVYSSMEEALEIFMNFHMEGYFNASPMVASVISELQEDLHRFQQKNGTISIQPACLIYVCQKNRSA